MCGFLICRKTWMPLLKIELRGQTIVFPIYPKQLGLANSEIGKHDEIYLWPNFHFNLLSHVRVIALFQRFIFAIFNVIFFKKLDQLEPNLVWMQVSCIVVMWGFFNMTAVTKNRTKGSVRSFSHTCTSPKLLCLATLSVTKMILIIRPRKSSRDQSCQTTHW